MWFNKNFYFLKNQINIKFQQFYNKWYVFIYLIRHFNLSHAYKYLSDNMSKIKGLLSAIKGNEEPSAIILPYNKQIEGYQKTIKKVIQAYNKSFV